MNLLATLVEMHSLFKLANNKILTFPSEYNEIDPSLTSHKFSLHYLGTLPHGRRVVEHSSFTTQYSKDRQIEACLRVLQSPLGHSKVFL